MRDEPTVLLTERTTHLSTHSGQIAFPGGKRDETDLDATHTALRFDCVGEDVLITGAGPIGVLAAAIVRHIGARHVVVAGTAELGADDRCHGGIDALDFLRRTREVLA